MSEIINELNKEIILIHTATASKLLKMGREGVDAFTLYSFYCWCSSWQLTNKVKATDAFCMKGLHWGKNKFHRAKNILLREGIIKPEERREKGKIKGWYIHISFLRDLTRGTKIHPVAEPEGGFQTTNAYIYKNISAYNNKKENNNIMQPLAADQTSNSLISGREINELISLFEPVNPNFYKIFPNKTQREALERMVKKHGLEKIRRVIESLPQIVNKPYAPRITTPYQLEQKLGELIIFLNQENQKGGVVDATNL